MDEAISTNISVDVSSPRSGTTISALILLMSSDELVDVSVDSSLFDDPPLNKKDKNP